MKAFDLNRLGLLFRRYFVENWKTEMFTAIALSIVFMPMFMHHNQVMIVAGCIMGAIYAARFFKEMHSPTNGISYLMLPVTALERTVFSIMMTTIYYLALILACYFIGILAGTGLNNLLAQFPLFSNELGICHVHALDFHFFSLNDIFLWDYAETPIVVNGISVTFVNYLPHTVLGMFLIQFLNGQAFFLLGGSWFKKNPFVKSFFTDILIFLVIIISISVLSIPNWSGDDFSPAEMSQFLTSWFASFAIITYVSPLLFWVATYFRHATKQV